MTKSYTANDIQVLEEIEHIQRNPSMYIGDLQDPTHLLFEILDNALDEAHPGYANIVCVAIDTKNRVISILDNGRGIPIENDTIKTVATKLFSGGKFNKSSDSVYKIAAGLHGIGIVAVTALSEWMIIEVYRDNKHAHYKFENAKLTEYTVDPWELKRPFSTKVSFKPSTKFFESIEPNLEDVIDRLKIASMHLTNVKFLFILDGEPKVIKENDETFFRTSVLQNSKSDSQTEILDFYNKVNDEYVKIKICWDFEGGITPKFFGCVNLLKVSAGTHILRCQDMIRDAIYEEVNKEKISITKNEALYGFRCYITLMLYRPEYSSQTKERLTTHKTKLDHLFKDLDDQFLKYLKTNEEFRSKIVSFFRSYKRRQNAKSAITTSTGITRYSTSIDSNLRDCTSHSVASSELFIVEGTSAGGGLIQARDPRIHAILSLKGKIPNIASDSKDFFKNAEIIDIINAMGTGIEPDFNSTSLRYGKIIISTDADADGSHISTLLMVVFLKLMPRVIELGHLYLAKLPLYGTTHNKAFIPIHTEEQLQQIKEQHPNSQIHRYKGLGEMNPDQLKVCLLDTERRKLIKVLPPQDPDDIFDIMTSASRKRELV